MSGHRPLQSSAPESQEPQRGAHVAEPIPDVCFIPDVCRALKVSRRTVERLLRFDAFPIPTLPALDRRHRWSGLAVRRWRDAEHGRQSGPRLLWRQR